MRETRVNKQGRSIGAAGGRPLRLPRLAAVTALLFALLVPAAAAQETGGATAPDAPPPAPEPALSETVAQLVADVSAPPTDQAPPPVPDPLAPAPEVPPAAEVPAPEAPAPPPVVPAPVPQPVLQSPPPAPAPEPVLQSPASTPAQQGGSGPTPPVVLTEPTLPVPAVELPALDPNPPLVEALPAGPQIPAGAALPTTGLPPFGSLVSPALDHPLEESQAADAADAAPPALVPLEVAVEAPLMEIGEGILPPITLQATPQPARTVDLELGQAIKLMDDLAGVKAAMTMLAEAGRAPSTGAPAAPGGHGSDEEAPDPAPSSEAPPLAGGAPSGAAGSPAPSGGGSAALYALLFALAAAVLGLWGRLQLVPVHWRSVAVVALVERPG